MSLVIPLCMLIFGLALVCSSANAAGDAGDAPTRDDSRTFDALLFLLCLVGIVAAKSARARDDDE